MPKNLRRTAIVFMLVGGGFGADWKANPAVGAYQCSEASLAKTRCADAWHLNHCLKNELDLEQNDY